MTKTIFPLFPQAIGNVNVGQAHPNFQHLLPLLNNIHTFITPIHNKLHYCVYEHPRVIYIGFCP